MGNTLVWQDFVEPEEPLNMADIEQPFEADFDKLWDPGFNELVKQDVKEHILKDLDNNHNIADTVIGCALNYLMSVSKSNTKNPWTSWNEDALYLNDYFGYPINSDMGVRLWEYNHPGYRFPQN